MKYSGEKLTNIKGVFEMKNKIADGRTAKYTATADLAAGGIALLFGRPGIAIKPIAQGTEGVLDMTGGVYGFTLTSGVSGGKDKGAKVYLPSGVTESNGSNLDFTSGAGKTRIGHLEEAVLDGGRNIKVRLLEAAIIEATELTIGDIKTALGISAEGADDKFMNEKGSFVKIDDAAKAAVGIDADGGDADLYLNEKGGYTDPTA